MADFVTRIELHSAVSGDYDRLHQSMERAGFSRTVSGHHLPTAEYWLVSNLSVDQVREKAKAAAASVKQSWEILVVQAENWSAYLTPVARKFG